MLPPRFAHWTAATSAAFLAALSFAAGCGGGERPDSPSTPVTPGPSGVVQVRGSERLGWTQTAPSLDAVRAHTYLVYVDGTPSSVGDVRCSDGGASGFSCSGRLPTMTAGRHVLELAAVW